MRRRHDETPTVGGHRLGGVKWTTKVAPILRPKSQPPCRNFRALPACDNISTSHTVHELDAASAAAAAAGLLVFELFLAISSRSP